MCKMTVVLFLFSVVFCVSPLSAGVSAFTDDGKTPQIVKQTVMPTVSYEDAGMHYRNYSDYFLYDINDGSIAFDIPPAPPVESRAMTMVGIVLLLAAIFAGVVAYTD